MSRKISGIYLSMVAIMMVFLFSFTSCSPANKDNVASGNTEIKVAFWGSPEEIDIVQDATAQWQAEHPEISIRFEHTPFSGYTSKILTRIAGGAAPDIIATEVNMFVDFASRGVLEDLNTYAIGDNTFSTDVFFPTVMDRFTVNDQLLAIPRDTAPFACMFYNKDLFEREGVEFPTNDWDWDDFLKIAKTLTRRDESGRVTQYGFYGWAWQNFVYSAGGRIVDDEKNPTRCLLDSDAAKQGLQFYVDLINKHRVMPAPVALSNLGMGIDIMFSSGRLGMFLSGIWETPSLRTRQFKWDVVMFPSAPNGKREFGTGGTGYAILKSSKNKAAAWEVIKSLTGVEGQKRLAEKGLAQPARIAVAEGPAFGANTDAPLGKGMLNEAVKHVVYSPYHPKWREIEAKIVMPALELLFNGKASVDETVARIVPQVNELLRSSE